MSKQTPITVEFKRDAATVGDDLGNTSRKCCRKGSHRLSRVRQRKRQVLHEKRLFIDNGSS